MPAKIWNDYGRFHLTSVGGGSAAAVKVLERGRVVSQYNCSKNVIHPSQKHKINAKQGHPCLEKTPGIKQNIFQRGHMKNTGVQNIRCSC